MYQWLETFYQQSSCLTSFICVTFTMEHEGKCTLIMKQCSQNKTHASSIKSDCCRNATTFWVPPVPQPLVFTKRYSCLFIVFPFPLNLRDLFPCCDLLLPVRCLEVGLYLCMYWLISRAWPWGRGLWGLYSIGEHYFCLVYLKWQQ